MTPSRRPSVLLILGLICSNLLVFAFSAYSLLESRQQYELRAQKQTQNIALALEENLSNSIEKIDLALLAVADELEHQLAGKGIDEAAMNAFLARHEQRLPEVEAFRVADADGLVILGKGLDKKARVNWADREYYLYHRDHADRTLQISKPRMGRVAKQTIVGFSQRYNTPDGRFAGVISAPIALDHFSRILSRFDVGPRGTFVLRGADLGLIARHPPIPDQPVGQVGNRAVSRELRTLVESGVSSSTLHASRASDGIERIGTFRRLNKAQMYAIVGVAAEDYLAAWNEEVVKTVAVASGFLLLSLFLGGLLLHLLRGIGELVQQRTEALLETEGRASHILNSSADGLYGVDRNGIITFINPAACALLGYRAEQVVGRAAHSLFHHSKADGTPYPAEACYSHNGMRLGEAVRIDDEVYWHADGHAVPVMYATHPLVHNGEIKGAVTSFVDVGVQRAAAQAREQALIAAEKLARVRSEFLANMSHEIRTPLNGVLGFADIGYRNCQNSEKARDAFAKIKTSGNRLLGVINDILDFSKIEAGKLSIEQTKVSLPEAIDNALELVRDRAHAKQLDLRVELAPDLPQTCIGDPLRMGQVLLNLLSNAVKFTEAGSVTLSASLQGDELVFRVADTGIGMTEELLGQLFNPFQQADASATRRFGGTGLGLAISKRILELMGGDIRVESRPGVGTTVEFRLPYIRPDVLAVGKTDDPVGVAEAVQKPLAGISILVAEDEVINRMVLEDNLIEDGASVVLVGTGREAVERVLRDGSNAYDIVLMDIQMPEMDGYEATQRILEIAPGLPIVAQTAHAFSEERDKFLAAGMVGHIAKPIDPDELVRIVRQHVPVRRKA